MTRLRSRSLSVLLVISISFTYAEAEQRTPGAMPNILTNGPSEQPLWLDSTSLLTPDGKSNVALLDAGGVALLQDVTSQRPGPDGCVHLGRTFVERMPSGQDRSNFDAAVETAPFIAIATVTGRSYGLFSGAFGQLLRLRIEKALKGRAGADSYFVFLPVGEFSVGATRLCVADPDYPHPPGVGDQVFVFTREPEGDSLNILMVESPADLLRVGPDGVVDLPPTYESLKREGKLTKTGLVRKIEAHGSKGK